MLFRLSDDHPLNQTKIVTICNRATWGSAILFRVSSRLYSLSALSPPTAAPGAPGMQARRIRPDSLDGIPPGKRVSHSGMHGLDGLGCLAGGHRLQADSLERLAGGQAGGGGGGGRAERQGQ